VKEDIKSLTLPQLSETFREMGQPAYRAKQVYEWLHGKRALSFAGMSNLPKELRGALEERFSIAALSCLRRQVSGLDGTEKLLLGLPDGQSVEAVLMRYKYGNTVCISTQVGCRMGCRFCASTLGGLVRGLTPGEMIDEVYAMERFCGEKVGGVVLMGIGEPLDNYENVLRFLTILSSAEGMNLSLRHVSLSTCGLVPEIDRLAGERLGLTLSVSLHAPDDETRKAIMPIARRYPLPELMAACRRYFERTGRRVSYEYALIAGKNDSPMQAKKLCALLAGQNCHVNLIPVNEVAERDCRRGSREAIERFQHLLVRGGLNATIRRELGSDISAACGQLRRETAAEEGM
jgi:23S rRNA (adenine2503-C2)-methyltransferase